MRVKVGKGCGFGAVTDRREDPLRGVTGKGVTEILAIDQGYARALGEEAFRSRCADAVRRTRDRNRLTNKALWSVGHRGPQWNVRLPSTAIAAPVT